jgi:hypothetical protein
MTNHEKTHDEEKVDDAVRGKRPYETPRLTKLGTVRELTQGIPDVVLPDDVGVSA